MFLAHTKRKSRRFQIPRVLMAFSKVPFVWRISVDGRPNRRNKAVLSNFSGVVWTESTTFIKFSFNEWIDESNTSVISGLYRSGVGGGYVGGGVVWWALR